MSCPSVLGRCLSCFDVLLFHVGINDISRGGDKFGLVPGGRVLCSSTRQTWSLVMNIRVGAAKRFCALFPAIMGGHMFHNNVRFYDLLD